MGKLLRFRPLRSVPKTVPVQVLGTECDKCQHKLDVHITHPNGIVTCAARGCDCESRSGR